MSKSRKISGYPTLQRSAESGVRQTASCGLPALRGAAALRLRPSHGTHRRCRPALPLQARQREGARRCLPGHFDTQILCFPTSPTCSAARDSTAPCRAAPGRHTMGHRGGGRGGGGPTSTRYRANLQSSYLCRFSQRSFDTIFTEHQRRTIRNKAKLTSASRPPLGAALSHGQPRTSTALTRRAPRPRRAQDRRKRPRRVARISCRARAHQLQGTRRERPEDSRSARFGLSAVSRRGTQRRLRPRGRPGGDVHVGRHWQPGPGSSAAVLEQVLGFPSSLRIKRSLRGSRRPRTARCTR